MHNHKRHHYLPQPLIRHAHHTRFPHGRMRKQRILHLEGMNILSAANNQILDAARDPHIALLIHLRLVPRVHPHHLVPLTIHLHLPHLLGADPVSPVPRHDVVARDDQLALLAEGQHPPRLHFRDHLRGHVRKQAADGIKTLVQRIIRRRHEAHGTRLRHPIADGQARQVEPLMQLPHQHARHRAPRRDARAEMLEALVLHRAVRQEFQLRGEHGRDAVERGRFLRLHRAQGGQWVEDLGRKDDRGPVRRTRHVSQDTPETVE